MESYKSVSEKRLIVDCVINNIHAYFLIDTGASVGLIDDTNSKRYGLVKGRRYNGTLIGAGGDIQTNYICNSVVNFGGKQITQFIMTNLSTIKDSIKKETGYDILGIIGLPQMKVIGMQVDTNDSLIIIE